MGLFLCNSNKHPQGFVHRRRIVEYLRNIGIEYNHIRSELVLSLVLATNTC